MDKFSGYVLAPDGIDVIDLAGTRGIRYSALLQDGTGIAAFDLDDRDELYQMAEFGRVFLSDEPTTIKVLGPPRAMRRRLEDYGDETFALIQPKIAPTEALRQISGEIRSGAIVAERIGQMYLFAEGTPDMPTFDGELWRSTVRVWSREVVGA